MKKYKFQRMHSTNPLSLKLACNVLKNGGIIAYPTDTIYGFGCDAKNNKAIDCLNNIKKRKGPMSVICSSVKKSLTWMKINEKLKKDAAQKMNKGTTVIIPIKKNIVSELITGKDRSLGIRIPEHPFCKELSIIYNNPITTTSVNRSGSNPYTNPDKIEDEFSNEIDILIDDGLIKGSASKIYQLINNKWKVIRL